MILNGPNLNRLGLREPNIYGHHTMNEVMQKLRLLFKEHELLYRQSNSEGELIDFLQEAADMEVQGIAFNAGAYTHYSIALADCIRSIDIPVIEVHISNVAQRETYRHISMIAPACIGTIAGFGIDSYRLAVEALVGKMR